MSFFAAKCILSVAQSSETLGKGMFFKPDNFITSLVYMGQGMLAIFVTIGIIVVATMIINKIKSKQN